MKGEFCPACQPDKAHEAATTVSGNFEPSRSQEEEEASAAVKVWECVNCHTAVSEDVSQCPECQHARIVPLLPHQIPKPWDWACSSCGFLQSAWRRACRNCAALKPLRCVIYSPEDLRLIDPETQLKELRPYKCMACLNSVASNNQRCLECGQPRLYFPAGLRLTINDWACTGCGSVTMAQRRDCIVCSEPQSKYPVRVLRPGWWTCPSCLNANYRDVTVCHHCKEKKPDRIPRSQLRIPAARRRKLILQRELEYQQQLRTELHREFETRKQFRRGRRR